MEVGLKERVRLAGTQGQVSGCTEGLEGRPLLEREDLQGDELLFWCLKSSHVEKSRYILCGL